MVDQKSIDQSAAIITRSSTTINGRRIASWLPKPIETMQITEEELLDFLVKDNVVAEITVEGIIKVVAFLYHHAIFKLELLDREGEDDDGGVCANIWRMGTEYCQDPSFTFVSPIREYLLRDSNDGTSSIANSFLIKPVFAEGSYSAADYTLNGKAIAALNNAGLYVDINFVTSDFFLTDNGETSSGTEDPLVSLHIKGFKVFF